MTDHQQAAIEAGIPVMRRHDRCPNDTDCKSCESAVQEIIAAAEPHLRKKWAKEIREEKTHVTSIDVGWNRAFGMCVGLEVAAKLLEGA